MDGQKVEVLVVIVVMTIKVVTVYKTVSSVAGKGLNRLKVRFGNEQRSFRLLLNQRLPKCPLNRPEKVKGGEVDGLNPVVALGAAAGYEVVPFRS